METGPSTNLASTAEPDGYHDAPPGLLDPLGGIRMRWSALAHWVWPWPVASTIVQLGPATGSKRRRVGAWCRDLVRARWPRCPPASLAIAGPGPLADALHHPRRTEAPRTAPTPIGKIRLAARRTYQPKTEARVGIAERRTRPILNRGQTPCVRYRAARRQGPPRCRTRHPESVLVHPNNGPSDWQWRSGTGLWPDTTPRTTQPMWRAQTVVRSWEYRRRS